VWPPMGVNELRFSTITGGGGYQLTAELFTP
jgi:hypothetical protein